MTYTNQAEGFFHRHRSRVFRYLRRAVGSADVAEDLSQEVFLRIVRGLPTYEERQLETAWVFRIVRRVLADHWRRPAIATGAEAAEDADVSRPAVQMIRCSLAEAIEHLSPLNREVLLMREVVGLQYDEIAAALDLTVAGVRGRLSRTREILQATVVFEPEADRQWRVKGGSRED